MLQGRITRRNRLLDAPIRSAMRARMIALDDADVMCGGAEGQSAASALPCFVACKCAVHKFNDHRARLAPL
jgi:hypothetical protein